MPEGGLGNGYSCVEIQLFQSAAFPVDHLLTAHLLAWLRPSSWCKACEFWHSGTHWPIRSTYRKNIDKKFLDKNTPCKLQEQTEESLRQTPACTSISQIKSNFKKICKNEKPVTPVVVILKIIHQLSVNFLCFSPHCFHGTLFYTLNESIDSVLQQRSIRLKELERC